jgi:hypothetical protein
MFTSRPLRYLLLLPILGSVIGCVDTGDGNEIRITDSLAAEVSRGSLMLGALATELALNIAAPPGPTACPAVSSEQDSLSFEYGSGCLSDTGLFELGLSGSVALTLAGGSGVFVGDVNSLGFPDLPILGSVSGQVSSAGDLVTADIQFSDLIWTEDGLENTIDALFELSIDGESIRMNVASGTFLRGGAPEFRVDLEDIIPEQSSLSSCWIPSDGQIVLEREAASATLRYSEVSFATGEVPVEYGSRDPATVEPCN